MMIKYSLNSFAIKIDSSVIFEFVLIDFYLSYFSVKHAASYFLVYTANKKNIHSNYNDTYNFEPTSHFNQFVYKLAKYIFCEIS